MRYVKLYENWINEAASVKLDMILSNGLKKTKESTDFSLNRLAKFGKTFESQIRKNISDFRSKYATNIWNNLNSKEGVDMAIKNFKELFFMSYGGSGYSNSPLTAFTVKVNNAIDSGLGDFFSSVTIDNDLWRSKEALELRDIIVNGNEQLAKGLAASIILLDISVAITNGMYFNANNTTLRRWNGEDNVNLGALLNSTLTGKFTSFDTLLTYGKESSMFIRLEDVWTTPYNPRIPTEWKGYKTLSNYSAFIPYVKEMTFDDIVESMAGRSNGQEPPREFFAPLFVGFYMSTDAMESINKASEFMQSGGPSLLQTAVSKFS